MESKLHACLTTCVTTSIHLYVVNLIYWLYKIMFNILGNSAERDGFGKNWYQFFKALFITV